MWALTSFFRFKFSTLSTTQNGFAVGGKVYCEKVNGKRTELRRLAFVLFNETQRQCRSLPLSHSLSLQLRRDEDTVSVLKKFHFTLHFYFQASLNVDAREVTCWRIFLDPTFSLPRNNFCVPSQYSQSLSLMSSMCVIVMRV